MTYADISVSIESARSELSRRGLDVAAQALYGIEVVDATSAHSARAELVTFISAGTASDLLGWIVTDLDRVINSGGGDC